jgi:hypothetical protein
VAHERFALWREPHLAAIALEQLRAQRALQFADRVRGEDSGEADPEGRVAGHRRRDPAAPVSPALAT